MIRVAETPHEKALVALLGMAGLRMHEALSLTTDSIKSDKQGRYIHVKGKGDRWRDVPVSQELWSNLEPAVDSATKYGLPKLVNIADRRARRRYTEIAETCGLKGYSSHSGRATLATSILENTNDIRLAQDILGHASVVTTQLYTLVSEQRKRDALEGL